jgi:protein TonB
LVATRTAETPAQKAAFVQALTVAPTVPQTPLKVRETIYVMPPVTRSRVEAKENPNFGTGARRLGPGIQPPKVVQEAKPLYSAEAMRRRIEGSVELEAVVLENGTVADVRVVRSLDPDFGLDEAAMKAARQWLFEPGRDSNLVPIPVIVSIVMDFRLDPRSTMPRPLAVDAPGVAGITPPHKLVHVQPIYPAVAQAAGVQGTVIVEATTNPQGRVISARVTQSVSGLDEAALTAIRQWIYSPALVRNIATPILSTVTVHFSLGTARQAAVQNANTDRPGGGAPLRVGGDIKEPKKIVDVRPIYPRLAQEAEVQGLIIIEATIDEGGNVVDARILRAVPMLDQAALDAVLQWKYTPPTFNGQPVSVMMTVTVNFTLGQ